MLSPGTRLGPYEITAAIGAGGMGEVYKGIDTRLNRPVAIKVISGLLNNEPDLRQRFDREARTISQLNHPHICGLYDVGEAPLAGSADPIRFLVLEFLEGETLAERLRRGPLPLEQALKYAAQICDALDKAHRAGIIHRDLKPGNVMLTKAGAKLLDFGLAKAAPAVSGAHSRDHLTMTTPLTAQGTILGTFQFMAPEQIEGADADVRSDIWSFGCVLYEMVTGRAPFTGKTTASLFGSILKDEPPPVSQVQPSAPPALDQIVQACLAKDPEERIQTAHDVALQLKWLTGATSRAPAQVPATPGRARRMHPRVYAGVAAALLLVGAAAFYVGRTQRRDPLAPPITFTILPPVDATFYSQTGAAPWPMLSPDGRQLAFVGIRDGLRQLWIRRLDNLTPKLIAGTVNVQVPFWSPDGRAIGFFADRKLRTVDLATGGIRNLWDVGIGFSQGSWSPDGTIIFSHDGSGIFRIAANGAGSAVPIVKVDATAGEISHSRPHFLPDNRRFLFLVRSSKPDTAGIYIGSLDSTAKMRVSHVAAEARYADGHIFFVSGRTLVAQPFDEARGQTTGDPIPLADGIVGSTATGVAPFSVAANAIAFRPLLESGGQQLVWHDRAGKTVGVLGQIGAYRNPQLSPDGSHVAVEMVSGSSGEADLWVIERARGVAVRLTVDAAADAIPRWSPDGKTIAYASDRGGNYEVYRQAANGAGAAEVVWKTSDIDLPLDWMPDGRSLLVTGLTPPRVLVVKPGAEKPIETHITGDIGLTHAQLSPDGRWLAYTAQAGTGTEVYLQSFPDQTGKWQVSIAGGTQPRWRGDGREIFYLGMDQRLMSAAMDGSRAVPKLTAAVPLFAIRPFLGATVTAGSTHQYDVTRDGQRFLVNTAPERHADSPITVVLNWRALLTR